MPLPVVQDPEKRGKLNVLDVAISRYQGRVLCPWFFHIQRCGKISPKQG